MGDFTHAEAVEAFTAFGATIGAKAAVYVQLEAHGRAFPLNAALYPEGICGKPRFETFAHTYRELLSNCEALWAEKKDNHKAATIRAMALEIITQTADQGECTDAALRAKFSAREVADYGEAACAQASEMASNGPFSIVALKGANAA